jgi:hypothetical protein
VNLNRGREIVSIAAIKKYARWLGGSDRRRPSLGGRKEVLREGERRKNVLRRLAHEKGKENSALLIFGGRTLA